MDSVEEMLVVGGLPSHARVDDDALCAGDDHVAGRGARGAVDEIVHGERMLVIIRIEHLAAGSLVDQSIDFILNAHVTSIRTSTSFK